MMLTQTFLGSALFNTLWIAVVLLALANFF